MCFLKSYNIKTLWEKIWKWKACLFLQMYKTMIQQMIKEGLILVLKKTNHLKTIGKKATKVML